MFLEILWILYWVSRCNRVIVFDLIMVYDLGFCVGVDKLIEGRSLVCYECLF